MTFLKRELTVTFSKKDGTVSNVTVSRSTENLLDEGWSETREHRRALASSFHFIICLGSDKDQTHRSGALQCKVCCKQTVSPREDRGGDFSHVNSNFNGHCILDIPLS